MQGLETLTNVQICYYKNLFDEVVIDEIHSYLSWIAKESVNI